ncbi:MAG: phospholipase D-like domain-containing protein [Candidatus Micrarchaeota archaeon]
MSQDWWFPAALLAFLALGFSAGYLFSQPQAAACVGSVAVQPVFSPGADAVLLPLLDSAEASIHVELYQFSYPQLRAALVSAAARGVEVRVILDPTVDSNLDTAEYLKSRGVHVRWSSRDFTRTHSKTAVVDGRRVVVGSINWSGAAMRENREAGVIVDDYAVAAEFERVFSADWGKASEVK